LSILAEIVQVRPDQALDAPLEAAADAAALDAAAAAPARTAIDPVCRMEVEIDTARYTSEVGGTPYYFCCPHCQSAFEKDPAAYPTGAHD
jgi:YHS domain-containing protein